MRLFTDHVSSEPLRGRLLSHNGLALQAKHHGAIERLLLRLAASECDTSLTAEKVGSNAGRVVIGTPGRVTAVPLAASIWQANGDWAIHGLVKQHLR